MDLLAKNKFIEDEIDKDEDIPKQDKKALKQQRKWKVQVAYDFESKEWICYVFRFDKKYLYKKFIFDREHIARYMMGNGQGIISLGNTLLDEYYSIQKHSEGFIRTLHNFTSQGSLS